jgi:hypothetical protein
VVQQQNTAAELDGFGDDIAALDEPERSSWMEAHSFLASAHEELVRIAADEAIGDPDAAAERARELRAVADGPAAFVRAAVQIVEPDAQAVDALDWLAAVNQSAAHFAAFTVVAHSPGQPFEGEDFEAFAAAGTRAEELHHRWYDSTSAGMRERYAAIDIEAVDGVLRDATTDARTPAVDPEVWLADVLALVEEYHELSLAILGAG